MRTIKKIISVVGGVVLSVHVLFEPGQPTDIGHLAVGFLVFMPLTILAIYIALTIGLFMLGFSLAGPGRGPVQPQRHRDSLPYNSSNDPKRW